MCSPIRYLGFFSTAEILSAFHTEIWAIVVHGGRGRKEGRSGGGSGRDGQWREPFASFWTKLTVGVGGICNYIFGCHQVCVTVGPRYVEDEKARYCSS